MTPGVQAPWLVGASHPAGGTGLQRVTPRRRKGGIFVVCFETGCLCGTQVGLELKPSASVSSVGITATHQHAWPEWLFSPHSLFYVRQMFSFDFNAVHWTPTILKGHQPTGASGSAGLALLPIPSALKKKSYFTFLNLTLKVCSLIWPLPPPVADSKARLSNTEIQQSIRTHGSPN